MNEPDRAEARRGLENKPETNNREDRDGAPRGPLDAPVTYSLRVISTAEDGAVRTVLFQRTTRDESIEISAEIDEPNLLARLPDFLDAALEIQRALWPAQRVLSKLPSSFLPLLAEESKLARRLTALRSDAPRDRAIERRRAAREAMIVRDVAWEALREVLEPRRRREIDALVGANETPAEIAVSMDAIAAFIDRMLRDPSESALLIACDIDAAYAASLRRHAAGLRDAEDAPRADAPRGLWKLIGTAYRVLRSEAFMTIPALHGAAWMIDATSPARPRREAKRARRASSASNDAI